MIQEKFLELDTRSNTGTEKQQNCRRHVRDKVGFWLHAFPDHKHKDVSSSIEQKLILNLVKVTKSTDRVTFESKEVDKIL
jgi:hypothetical protein